MYFLFFEIFLVDKPFKKAHVKGVMRMIIYNMWWELCVFWLILNKRKGRDKKRFPTATTFSLSPPSPPLLLLDPVFIFTIPLFHHYCTSLSSRMNATVLVLCNALNVCFIFGCFSCMYFMYLGCTPYFLLDEIFFL